MNNVCQYSGSKCEELILWVCEVWISDSESLSGWSPKRFCLCDLHTEEFMRNDLRSELSVWSRRFSETRKMDNQWIY